MLITGDTAFLSSPRFQRVHCSLLPVDFLGNFVQVCHLVEVVVHLTLCELFVEDQHVVKLVQTVPIHAHEAEELRINFLLTLHYINLTREDLLEILTAHIWLFV